MDDVSTQLEKARKELLYLGLRNPLLNYRPLQARGVDVVDELPTELYRLLVMDGKRMVFEERGEREGSTGEWGELVLGRETGPLRVVGGTGRFYGRVARSGDRPQVGGKGDRPQVGGKGD